MSLYLLSWKAFTAVFTEKQISFFNPNLFYFLIPIYIYVYVCVCVCAWVLSHVWLFVTPWAVAHKGPLSMEFSRQEYWSGLPFPSPGDLPDSGIKPMSPALAGGFFTPGNPIYVYSYICICLHICVCMSSILTYKPICSIFWSSSSRLASGRCTADHPVVPLQSTFQSLLPSHLQRKTNTDILLGVWGWPDMFHKPPRRQWRQQW